MAKLVRFIKRIQIATSCVHYVVLGLMFVNRDANYSSSSKHDVTRAIGDSIT
jgi:hypothetical protein